MQLDCKLTGDPFSGLEFNYKAGRQVSTLSSFKSKIWFNLFVKSHSQKCFSSVYLGREETNREHLHPLLRTAGLGLGERVSLEKGQMTYVSILAGKKKKRTVC